MKARLLIWIVLFLQFIFLSNILITHDAICVQSTNPKELFSDADSDTSGVKLITPGFKNKVTTTTPTFSWRSLPSESLVEYRLLVAWPNGKIIIDQWIGSDTAYTIPPDSQLDDLKLYHWLVHAYQGNESIKSRVWSFWIDRDIVTDLKIDNARIISRKKHFRPGDEIKIQVQLQNCGPEKIDRSYLILFSGQTNRNYFDYSAIRKTVALDTLELKLHQLNTPVVVTLQGCILPGLNNINLRLEPGNGFKEIYWRDNFMPVEKIQTQDEILQLKGLFVIYKNYFDPDSGLQKLDSDDMAKISTNIRHFQQYFWEHTHILKLDADTIHVNRTLRDNNFIYQNDYWGYVFPPNEVEKDLASRKIDLDEYHFGYAYYSWRNSNASWSTYGGYTYANQTISDELYYLAQPTTPGKFGDEFILIHEFIHLLDHLFEDSGAKEFYSPHHRTLYTTFTNESDYFAWLLETWPSEKWFMLQNGQRLVRDDLATDSFSEKMMEQSQSIALLQNYPNPFNQITTLTYKIPTSESFSSGARVKLIIYDLLGNKVQTLLNTRQKPGTYQVFWNGADENNNAVATGIYFYELQVDHHRQVKKLLIIR